MQHRSPLSRSQTIRAVSRRHHDSDDWHSDDPIHRRGWIFFHWRNGGMISSVRFIATTPRPVRAQNMHIMWGKYRRICLRRRSDKYSASVCYDDDDDNELLLLRKCMRTLARHGSGQFAPSDGGNRKHSMGCCWVGFLFQARGRRSGPGDAIKRASSRAPFGKLTSLIRHTRQQRNTTRNNKNASSRRKYADTGPSSTIMSTHTRRGHTCGEASRAVPMRRAIDLLRVPRRVCA